MNIEEVNLNTLVWNELESIPNGVPDPEPNPDFPTVTTTVYGPLINTKWSQGCGFNSKCPPASDGPCGYALTGCVATAMAQIMRYHSYPQNYNWNNMPPNYGNTEIATLMRDIGNTVSMDYGGSGSDADTKEEARDAFVNAFGYSSNAKYIDYIGNQSMVEQQIKWGYPVLMRGGDKKYWGGLIPYYADGHAWVCDGSKRVSYSTGNSYLYLYMNWGWYNGSNNGWFAFNNLSPSDYDFNYKTGCVINIHP